MSNAVETFKQPFLSEIESALDKAVSITWEGCHKIYVALDMEGHNNLAASRYKLVPVQDKTEALNQLYEWFDISSGLRFISGLAADNTFHTVIRQFDYDEEENE